MSHFTCLVIVEPGTTDIEARVSELMAPFSENDEWFREGSHWDWWVIGGRWAGALGGKNPKYNPNMNEANYEKCEYCKGTGTRADTVAATMGASWTRQVDEFGHPVIGEGCNGCYGTGYMFKFASEWEVPEDGNIRPIKDLPEDFRTFALLTPDGEWHAQGEGGWWATVTDDKGEAWKKEFDQTVAKYAPDHIAVLVDYHI